MPFYQIVTKKQGNILPFSQIVTKKQVTILHISWNFIEKTDSIFLRLVQAKTVAASRHLIRGCYLQCFQTQMHERTDLVELIEGFPEKKEQIAQRENSAEFVTSLEVFVDTAKNVPCKY